MSLLPSVLPQSPGVTDNATTPEEVKASEALARVAAPQETALFICAFEDCHRLYPSRDRLMAHRKRDHDSEETSDIITWNE